MPGPRSVGWAEAGMCVRLRPGGWYILCVANEMTGQRMARGLGQMEGLWSGRALPSPSRPQTRAVQATGLQRVAARLRDDPRPD